MSRRVPMFLTLLLAISVIAVIVSAVRCRRAAGTLRAARSDHASVCAGVEMLREDRARPALVLPYRREEADLLVDVRHALANVQRASSIGVVSRGSHVVAETEADAGHIRQRTSVVLRSISLTALGAFLQSWVRGSAPEVPVVIELTNITNDVSHFDVLLVFEVLHCEGEA